MNSDYREELLMSIANTVSDYRVDEIPRISADHVEHWVEQFTDEVQEPILEEINHLLARFYITRTAAKAFLRGLVSNQRLLGDSPEVSLRGISFLRLQKKVGSSQRDLLELLDDVMDETYGITTDQCGEYPSSYLYLDDCLYTGNRVRYDLEKWIPTAAKGTKLYVIFLGMHTQGWKYVNNKIKPLADSKGIPIHCWRQHQFDNDHIAAECLWPREVQGDPDVDNYVARLRETTAGASFAPRLFRSASVPRQDRIFSSSNTRGVLERELMSAGAYIMSLCKNPKVEMRPMGYEKLNSLGFGAFFATYRNISNNCPLALWWGDPEGDPPLSKWRPLLPRKVNADE